MSLLTGKSPPTVGTYQMYEVVLLCCTAELRELSTSLSGSVLQPLLFSLLTLFSFNRDFSVFSHISLSFCYCSVVALSSAHVEC